MAEETKRNRIVKSFDKDFATGKATLTVANDRVLGIAVGSVPKDLHLKLALHGLVQKVSDAFASAKGDVGLAHEAATKVYVNLTKGTWTERVAGVPSELVGARVLTRMVADYPGIAKLIGGQKPGDAWEKLTDDQKKTLRASAEYKASKAKMDLDAAKTAPSATAVLAG